MRSQVALILRRGHDKSFVLLRERETRPYSLIFRRAAESLE